jgi:hypothetical protein
MEVTDEYYDVVVREDHSLAEAAAGLGLPYEIELDI